jgi:sugar phosphate isomerase/epimerase
MKKLNVHNSMWPGLVGKGGEKQEPFLTLDQMLDLTVKANKNGKRFDGVDIFLSNPHTSIDSTKDDIKKLADKIAGLGLVVGDTVAPVWGGTGGGSALFEPEKWLTQVRKACQISNWLDGTGIRTYGIVRIDTATEVAAWKAENPSQRFARLKKTIQAACEIASDYGQRLAAEGEPSWGGMHSLTSFVRLIKEVNRPMLFGGQLDLAHLANFMVGAADKNDRVLPEGWKNEDWKAKTWVVEQGFAHIGNELEGHIFSLHAGQTNGGLYTADAAAHAATGKHVPVDDPSGVLDITACAGAILYKNGQLRPGIAKALSHVCWDGCMFENKTLEDSATWDKVLAALLDIAEKYPLEA